MALELVETVIGKENPTIEINTDKSCKKCGEKGQMKNGLCLKCNAKQVKNICHSCLQRAQTSDGLCIVCTLDLRKYEDPIFNRELKDQEFAPAHEAADIGEILVPRFHFHLDNEEVRIEYVFLKKTPNVKGRDVLGRAKKVSGLNAWLALPETMRASQTVPESFFLIEFAWEPWAFMKPWQRVALVDHELKHCTIDENAKPMMNSHDYEEFVEIYERYGDWRGDFRLFLDAMKEREKTPLFSQSA